MKKYILLLVLMFAYHSYATTVYKTVNNKGQVIYTNKPLKNAEKIQFHTNFSKQESKLKKLINQDPNLKAQWETNKKLHKALQLQVIQAFTAYNASENNYRKVIKENKEISRQLSKLKAQPQKKAEMEAKRKQSTQTLLMLNKRLTNAHQALTKAQKELDQFHAVLVRFR